MKYGSKLRLMVALIPVGMALAGCGDRDKAPEPEPTAEREKAPVSIIRPDVEQPAVAAEVAPLEMRISFAEGGSDLSEGALAELATLRESPQLAAGWPIILRAHGDSAGTDDANIRATQSRGEAVRDWLVEMGVKEERITVIAFGEQNPIEPNAMPDGTPNEAGRAANRRVDVLVGAPEVADQPPGDEDDDAAPAEADADDSST